MANSGWRLPDRLPPIGDRAARWVRRAWIAAMIVAVAIQIAGACFVLHDAYVADPALEAVGIKTSFGDVEDEAIATPIRADVAKAGIAVGSHILRVGDADLGRNASAYAIARAVIAVPGDTVRLRVRNPDGKIVDAAISRTAKAPLIADANPIPKDVRMIVRLIFTLLCTVSLLVSTTILFRRRSRDAEAMLIAFAFLGIAATVDPPLLMWLSFKMGWVIDWLSAIWWTLLVVAFAAFPDGRFTPRALRWSLIVAPVIGLVLGFDEISEIASLLIGVVAPILLLAVQIVRFRRLPPGLERQQIKWAGFGFATGFFLAGVALLMTMVPFQDWNAWARAIWQLAIVCIFNLAFAILPLGLLVSLLRFRLWDVDAVISRSAAYALISGTVGLTWAASADLVKAAVTWGLGESHSILGLTIGAIVAFALFGPTQTIVTTWSKRRFERGRLDLAGLPARLGDWSGECDAPTVAMRALDTIVAGVHADGGAILIRTPLGRAILAAEAIDDAPALATRTNAEIAADTRFVRIDDLADGDGTVGWLLLGKRTDGASYSRSNVADIEAVLQPLAEALRTATARAISPVIAPSLLEEVQARLARLEQGQPKPA